MTHIFCAIVHVPTLENAVNFPLLMNKTVVEPEPAPLAASASGSKEFPQVFEPEPWPAAKHFAKDSEWPELTKWKQKCDQLGGEGSEPVASRWIIAHRGNVHIPDRQEEKQNDEDEVEIASVCVWTAGVMIKDGAWTHAEARNCFYLKFCVDEKKAKKRRHWFVTTETNRSLRQTKGTCIEKKKTWLLAASLASASTDSPSEK